MDEILYCKDAMKLLGYKDYRPFEAWCSRHGLAIHDDDGKHGKYVIRFQFWYVRMSGFVLDLMSRFPKTWPHVLKAYTDKDIIKLIEIEACNITEVHNGLNQIEPIGEKEKMYLSRLQKRIREL